MCLWILSGVTRTQCASFAGEATLKSDGRTLEVTNYDDLKNITIRAGILLAPPFAMYGEDSGIYTGFQGDLLGRLQTFAKADGFNLNFELELSPPQYGAALDLVANDCNSTVNPNPIEECQRFELIIGDYYVNGPRSMRIDFSPTWLKTTMSTIKTVKDPKDKAAQLTDFTTLTQLQAGGGTACVPEGTYLREVVMNKFPRANYSDCPSPNECVQRLRDGVCSLYVDDELALRYRALNDRSLEVTGEQFNTQYIVWPISYNMDREKSLLLKKWMYTSVSNATLDDLSYKYFDVKVCPLGLAGPSCDKKCDPKHGTSDRDGKCICQSSKWTGEDCSIEVEEDLNLYPDWEVYLAYALFAINAFACLLCFVWVHLKRYTRLVKLWQPFFLKFILLGCFVSSASIIPTTQQSEGDGPVYGCMVFPWLYCIGFSITLGTLLSKIFRVYRLFQAASRAQRVTITARETLLMIFGITIVDVAVIAVWSGVAPLHWKRTITSTDHFGQPLSSAGYCTSDYWKVFVTIIVAWHLVLMLMASYLCYLTRNISSQFAESKYLAISLFSNLQITVVSTPVLIIVKADPSTSLFIRSIVIWINDFAILAIIFGNLMYSVHTIKVEIDISTAVSMFSVPAESEAARRRSDRRLSVIALRPLEEQ